MRCYFTYEGRFWAAQPIDAASDDDAIAKAIRAYYDRIDAGTRPVCDGFELWDGMRFIHRHGPGDQGLCQVTQPRVLAKTTNTTIIRPR